MRIYKKGKDINSFKTGLAIRDSFGRRSSLYQSWMNMKQRCLNPKNPKYYRYGGRGIKICAEWKDIRNFQEWAMSNGWEEGLSIDRIDNDGDYCPSNCRWISLSQNARKKRTTKITDAQATEIRSRKEESISKLAEEYGSSWGNIWMIQKNITHVAEGECAKEIKRRRSLRAASF